MSLVVWACVFCLEPLRETSPSIARHFSNLPALFGTLALLVNFPHFMASYRLAYTDGASWIRSSFLQRVAVPAALIALIAAAYFFYSRPLHGQTAGPLILGGLVNVMYFTVGWHYANQVFGCSLAYARFDGYPINEAQRLILKATLFCVWALNFLSHQMTLAEYDYYGLKYLSYDLPAGAMSVFAALQAVTFGLLLYFMLWKNWTRHRLLPSANACVPVIAFFAWWLPILRQKEYYFYAVAFFHSLQYLAFVHKVEAGATRATGTDEPSVKRRLAWLALALGVAGYFAFEGIPESLDLYARRDEFLNVSFFAISFTVFINIHHYFLDNMIWRKGTKAHGLMSQV